MATLEDSTVEGERVVSDDRQYLIHSWSVQSAIGFRTIIAPSGT